MRAKLMCVMTCITRSAVLHVNVFILFSFYTNYGAVVISHQYMCAVYIYAYVIQVIFFICVNLMYHCYLNVSANIIPPPSQTSIRPYGIRYHILYVFKIITNLKIILISRRSTSSLSLRVLLIK